MPEIIATFHGGVFVPDTPVDAPEGTKVSVHMPNGERRSTDPAPVIESFHMMREEDWPTTPEGIAAHLERMRSFEPPEMSEEELRSLAEWRAEMKRFNIEAMRKQMGL